MTDDPVINMVESIRLFPEIGQATWAELIIATYVDPYTSLHRELADPTSFATVRDMALAYGVFPIASYVAYRRLLPSHDLESIGWLTPIVTGLSVVVIPGNMPADGLRRITSELASRPEILPARMVWPV